MDYEATQYTYRKLVSLFDKWSKHLGEPAHLYRCDVRDATVRGMAYARYEGIFGTNIDLKFLVSTEMRQKGTVWVSVELQMLRNLPGDEKLSRRERDDAYYERRDTTLEDVRGFLYCPEYPNTYAVEWEEIEGYINRIIPFYAHFLAEEVTGERSIPLDTHSYELFRKKEYERMENQLRYSLWATMNQNYRLED